MRYNLANETKSLGKIARHQLPHRVGVVQGGQIACQGIAGGEWDNHEAALATAATATAIYARVSSHDQKNDLDAQARRAAMWAAANGYVVTRVVTEIGSGLNPQRKQLTALSADSSVKFIVVERRDRLMRFASEYIEASFGPRKSERSS